MSYLQYAQSLMGVPYGHWNGTAIPRDDSTPFYASTGPVPTRKLFETQGIACTGLLNLVRRRYNLPVPGVEDTSESFPGGTAAWYKFLEPHLKPFDPAKKYPNGTLLFRPYASVEDQGHIALLIDGKVLHSFPYIFEPHTPGTLEPGVCVTPVWEHSYTHTAPLDAWLPTAAE